MDEFKMVLDPNVCRVTIIMLVMGWLGGTINHFLLKEGEERKGSGEKVIYWRYGRALFIGVGAALLIPLFLSTISSKLLENAIAGENAGVDSFVLASFCLLAAITSRAFITTLADKVLKEVREAKEEAFKAAQQVEEIAESVSEPAIPAEQAASAVAMASEADLAVLRAIDSSK